MNHLDPDGTTAVHLTVGDRVKAVRQAWRWSQKDLAFALKVDQATISFWERDLIKPGGTALIALASLFRIRVEALEEGLDFRIPDSPSRPEPDSGCRSVPRSLGLPSSGAHALAVVDLGDGSCQGRDLPEAMITMAQGFKESRRVWLVLE